MSDGKVLSIRVVTKDDASKGLQNIGKAAQTLGDELEQAGDEGTKALKEMDAQAKKTDSSMGSLSDRAMAVGAAFGTLAGFAAKAGSEYRNQERQIEVINRLYGEQSDAILELAESTQDLTRYSNDSAREALVLFGSLQQSYGITQDQTEGLLGATTDLAAAFNADLADAATRVSAGVRGEAEALEAYGITLNDTFVASEAARRGLEGWTTTMSEAEKAAFRYTLLMEQVASYQGLAAEQAEGAGGWVRNMTNEFGDATQAVGGFLGPIGQVAAELAPIAIALPVVGAGLGKVQASLAGTALATRASTLGFGALSMAMTPVGLGVTAIAAAAGILAKEWWDGKQAADSYNSSLMSLEETIEMLRRQGDGRLADEAQQTLDVLEDMEGRIEAMAKVDLDVWKGKGGIKTMADELGISMEEATQRWQDMVNAIDVDSDIAVAAISKVNEALADPNIDTQAYLDWVEMTLNGATTAEEMITALKLIEETPLSDFRREVNETTESLKLMTIAAELLGSAFGSLRTDGQKMADGLLGSLTAIGAAAVQSGADQVEAIQQFNDATIAYLENGDNILDFWLEYKNVANQGAAGFDGTAEQLERIQASMDFRVVVEWASALGDANAAMDEVLRTFSQIDALGSRGEGASSIATALVGTEGEWAAVDDLLQQNRISLEQYNATVESGYAIQAANVEQQALLNEVRADQLPLLEQQTVAYSQYLQSLAAMEPLEQRRALMLSDTAVQQKIASDYALAYSASLGEVPLEVATSVILQSAEADAGLKDLYLEMGLITEVWENGEKVLKVNFPDADSTVTAIQSLTDSIDALTIAMGGVPPLRVDVDTAEADNSLEAIVGRLMAVDGQTATPTVTADTAPADNSLAAIVGRLMAVDGQSATVDIFANDMASGVIGAIQGALGAIPRSITTTVYTNRVGVGPSEFAMGGVVLPYANGGVVQPNMVPIWAGENGPEIAHFANGGTSILPHEGLYAVPAMTYISPSNGNTYGGATIHAPFNNYAPIYGVDDLDERFAQHTQQLADALERNRLSTGAQ